MDVGEIIDRMKFPCGCGEPRRVLLVIREVLEMLEMTGDPPIGGAQWKERWPKIDAWLLKNGDMGLFILYVIDSWNLTDHGSSLLACWLTDEGQEVLMFLRATDCSHDAWVAKQIEWANKEDDDGASGTNERVV